MVTWIRYTDPGAAAIKPLILMNTSGGFIRVYRMSFNLFVLMWNSGILPLPGVSIENSRC